MTAVQIKSSLSCGILDYNCRNNIIVQCDQQTKTFISWCT